MGTEPRRGQLWHGTQAQHVWTVRVVGTSASKVRFEVVNGPGRAKKQPKWLQRYNFERDYRPAN